MNRAFYLAAVLMLLACGAGGGPSEEGEGGVIAIDGSSTVYPITEAVAEEFRNEASAVRVTIGISGTGGGFKKFVRRETDISNASRPIKESELALAAEAGIEFIELPVAYDGLAVVVNPDNDWCDAMTVAELKKLWEPAAQGTLMRWNQIREGWPDEEIQLFGPGIDSGTYDYFTQAIAGEEGASRGDFTSSEDDNVLVQGVSGNRNALGFFGFAYYEENKERLKLVGIDDGRADNGDGAIRPSLETVGNGTYQPLSRPVFIYVRRDTADRSEVERFVEFYIQSAPQLVAEVGYIPLPDSSYDLVLDHFRDRETGTVFGAEGATVGVSVEDLLKRTGN